MKKDGWFKEVAKRCPWYSYMYNQHCCEAVGASHGLRMQCSKGNCAPFYMAAIIISAYKEWGADSTKQPKTEQKGDPS